SLSLTCFFFSSLAPTLIYTLSLHDALPIYLRSAGGVSFDAGCVVIAAGVGSFQPRRIALPGAEAFEGTRIHYRVKSAAELEGQRLVIFGGGDSALDWTLELLGKATSLTLVHRRHEFRAAPASVARMQQH